MSEYKSKYNVFSLLDRVSKRPSMYFSEVNLSSLCIFLTGYEAAVRDYRVPQEFKGSFFTEFALFLKREYKFNYSTNDWILMVLELTFENMGRGRLVPTKGISTLEHEESVSLFFELVKKFKAHIQK